MGHDSCRDVPFPGAPKQDPSPAAQSTPSIQEIWQEVEMAPFIAVS